VLAHIEAELGRGWDEPTNWVGPGCFSRMWSKRKKISGLRWFHSRQRTYRVKHHWQVHQGLSTSATFAQPLDEQDTTSPSQIEGEGEAGAVSDSQQKSRPWPWDWGVGSSTADELEPRDPLVLGLRAPSRTCAHVPVPPVYMSTRRPLDD
jgi:hypothetical protein